MPRSKELTDSSEEQFQDLIANLAVRVNGVVAAALENHENYCAEVRIPVNNSPTLHLDLENLEIGDGVVFVFGEDAN